MTIIYQSEITGSTWNIELDKNDYSLQSCYLTTKAGKMSKVILTPKRDWLLWLFLKKNQLLSNN